MGLADKDAGHSLRWFATTAANAQAANVSSCARARTIFEGGAFAGALGREAAIIIVRQIAG